MKIIILYASVHHGNTRKLVKCMADAVPATLVDITKDSCPDISGYDVIGLASGVYFFTLHESIVRFLEQAAFEKGQQVFFVDTCGVAACDYTKKLKSKLQEKGVPCLGAFQCRGYDTYGFWGKIGGIARKHPNEKDFRKAQQFLKSITARDNG